MDNQTSRGIPKASEVDPIKNTKDIDKVKQYLLGKKNKRDYLLFVMGINVGLRAGDLLSLKICDVANIINNTSKVKDSVTIYEEKTGKKREFNINNSAKKAIELYLNSLDELSEQDYLFQSERKGNIHLRVDSTHKIIKSIMRDLGIKGNFGTHTLRKTFAYHVYINGVKEDPGILEKLQKILNHSSPSVTLKYIGITKDVIANVYNKLNL